MNKEFIEFTSEQDFVEGCKYIVECKNYMKYYIEYKNGKATTLTAHIFSDSETGVPESDIIPIKEIVRYCKFGWKIYSRFVAEAIINSTFFEYTEW